jgi:hypothetical protein
MLNIIWLLDALENIFQFEVITILLEKEAFTKVTFNIT